MKIIFLLSFSFALFSCSKKDTNYSSICVSGSDVYIVGDYNNEAALWKNGEKVQLDSVKGTYSYATSVFISGNDVYVAGIVNDKPVLWKNSKYKIIDNSANYSQRCYVFVSGTDVYIAGTVQYGNTINGNGEMQNDMENSAVLWKNDKKIILAKCQSCYATSIAVSGMDVYVGGVVGRTGMIWKRDSVVIAESDEATVVDVTYSAATAFASTSVNIGITLDSNMMLSKSKEKFDVDIDYIYDICVSGSDIYAIGSDDNNMIIFKNGISIDKKYRNQFSCIYVSNKDVYVGGDDRGSSTGMSASMWKNGNIINLGKNYSNSSIKKIFVKGSDVYCVGNGKKSENGNYIGILWKNGIVIN